MCASPQLPAAWRRPRGFTILEILVALALLALLGGIFATSSYRLLNRPMTPEDIFWRAVTEARKYALFNQRDVQLAYDEKGKAFLASTIDGSRTYPVPYEGELTLDFLRVGSDRRSSILLGGVLVETEPLPSVTFYADGTCSPFRVQIRTGGSARYISIDPWTCAPVLAKKETF